MKSSEAENLNQIIHSIGQSSNAIQLQHMGSTIKCRTTYWCNYEEY